MIDQGEFFEIPNPCKKICVANNKGFCKGCFRSREERQNWYSFSDFQRHLVSQACALREKRVKAAKWAKEHPEHAFVIAEVQDDLFTAAASETEVQTVLAAESNPAQQLMQKQTPVQAPTPVQESTPAQEPTPVQAPVQKSTPVQEQAPQLKPALSQDKAQQVIPEDKTAHKQQQPVRPDAYILHRINTANTEVVQKSKNSNKNKKPQDEDQFDLF